MSFNVGDREFQKQLRIKLVGWLVVEDIDELAFKINGERYWKARFKKVCTSSQIFSKYSKVINKIKEMKSRREQLGYKY